MAIGDQYAPITPFDRFILDSNENVVGVSNPRSGKKEFRPAVPVTDSVTGAVNLISDGLDVMASMSIVVAASRNAALTDSGNLLKTTSGSATVITILNDATTLWQANETIALFQYGAGTPSFAAGAGVTFRGTPPTMTQYGSPRGIMRIGANEWAFV